MHTTAHEAHHDTSHDLSSKTFFGFWLYLMTDCILFATIFATYAVLQKGTAGGPSARELTNLPLVLIETLVLLTSSFLSGTSQAAANQEKKGKVISLLSVTFVLGLAFLVMVLRDFSYLIQTGNDWRASAFLSSYFVLVGTLLFHVVFGLLWMIVMMGQISKRGLIASTHRRLTCLRLFWHFLNVVWVFIFSLVYLMGAI